jgi:hypothetical protein
MQALGFSIVELLQLVRTCGTLQLDKCSATFLSDYLAANLAASEPNLAVKVRRLDEDDLEALCDCLKGVKASLRSYRPEPEWIVAAG